MITYEEFLNEPVPINKQYTLTREEYYKRFIPHGDPRIFYDQLVKIEQEKKE